MAVNAYHSSNSQVSKNGNQPLTTLLGNGMGSLFKKTTNVTPYQQQLLPQKTKSPLLATADTFSESQNSSPNTVVHMPGLQRQGLMVHKKNGGVSKQKYFVPQHQERVNPRSFAKRGIKLEVDDATPITKKGSQIEEENDVNSERLYDDSDGDMRSGNGTMPGEWSKENKQDQEMQPSFNDYVQQQINNFFDHTNYSTTVSTAPVSHVNVLRSHTRTKSYNVDGIMRGTQSSSMSQVSSEQQPHKNQHESINKQRRPLSSVRKTGMQKSNLLGASSARPTSGVSRSIRHVQPPKQIGAELDPELCLLYKLLNKDCQQINHDKKQKIIQKSAKKGFKLKEKDVNLLQLPDHLAEGVSSSSSGDLLNEDSDIDLEEEGDQVVEDLRKNQFEIKLQTAAGKQALMQKGGMVKKQTGAVQDFRYEEESNESDSFSRSSSPQGSPSRASTAANPYTHKLTKYNSMILHKEGSEMQKSVDFKKDLTHSAEKQRKPQLKNMQRRNTDVTLIQDIVKRKRITFLKSSHLFSQEEQLFGAEALKDAQKRKDLLQREQTLKSKNKQLIKSNLEEKKKIEGAIEKMSIGGDRLVLETIGRQIQFAKEKEFIYKLLIGQAMGGGGGGDGDPSGKKGKGPGPSQDQKNLILNQLKEKQDSHQNVMALLIEKVLSDDETRERLLDQSVLNDFYFEEKLKEKRLQVIQEQQRSAALNRGRKKRHGSSGTGTEVIDCNLGNEVLDSLQHLPEVIKPEHIKVNISGSVADRGQIVPPKEKDNIYHRTIVKKAIQANLNSNKLKMQRFSNLQIINYILHYTTAASKAESRAAAAAQTYSTIVNLRKVYAYTATLNSDKYGHSVNFSKWITLTKQVRGRFHNSQMLLIDTVDLERIFYEIVRSKSPSEMTFEDFVEGLRALSRRLAKVLVKENNESQLTLLANEDFLFNRFLTDVLKPLFDENKNKEIEGVFECPLIQAFLFKSQNTFFRKMYSSFKEYPVDKEDELPGKGNGGFLNPMMGGLQPDDDSNSQGIAFSHIIEVMKVLDLCPQVLTKHELQSLFVQSLTMHDALSYSEFIYFMFMFFSTCEDKQRSPSEQTASSVTATFQTMSTAFRQAFIKQQSLQNHNNNAMPDKPTLGQVLAMAKKHALSEGDQQRVVKKLSDFFIQPKLNIVHINKQPTNPNQEGVEILTAEQIKELREAKVTVGGEVALEKIKECHNEIILNRLNSKAGANGNQASAFGKHYSVNIKANIM